MQAVFLPLPEEAEGASETKRNSDQMWTCYSMDWQLIILCSMLVWAKIP